MKWIERAAALVLLVGFFAIGSAIADNGTRTPSPHSAGALPPQSGQSGKYLTTNGTAASWASALSCPACSTNQPVYYNGTALASLPFLYATTALLTSTDSNAFLQLAGGGQGGAIWFQNGTGGASTLNGVFTDNLGVHLYRNDVDIVDLIGQGASLELRSASLIESTTGGFKFPDGTTQTTAATAAVVQEVFSAYDLAQQAADVGTTCGASRPPFVAGATTGTNRSAGMATWFPVSATAKGVSFFHSTATTETATCQLWTSNANAPVLQASGTVAVSANGKYTCTFTTPFSIVASTASEVWWMVYQPAGYSTFGGCTTSGSSGLEPDAPAGSGSNQVFAGGPHFYIWGSTGMKSAGTSGSGASGAPASNAAGGIVSVTPIFTVP